MARPLVRFVECDGCGTRDEQPASFASQWITPRWAEIFDRTSGTDDTTKHLCGPCKAEVMETIERIRVRRNAMITPDEHSRIMSGRKKVRADLVLVHTDGGECHGTALVNGQCPGCGVIPDMQSTEMWEPERTKRTRCS